MPNSQCILNKYSDMIGLEVFFAALTTEKWGFAWPFALTQELLAFSFLSLTTWNQYPDHCLPS